MDLFEIILAKQTGKGVITNICNDNVPSKDSTISSFEVLNSIIFPNAGYTNSQAFMNCTGLKK